MSLFALDRFSVGFRTFDGDVQAVRGVSLALEPGRCLGIVGESGSGKSQMMMAAFGLLATNGWTDGAVHFDGAPLTQAQARLGRDVGFVFQDPLTSLTPHRTIGRQMSEGLRHHLGLSLDAALRTAEALLDRCRIERARERLNAYPHELSGGMRQRVMIAQALALRPRLLVADEPTTALDVTVQAEILSLLAELRRDDNLSLVLISHDVGVVAGLADEVAVMQTGRIVEHGPAEAVLVTPSHPYTRALIAAVHLPQQAVPASPSGQTGPSGASPVTPPPPRLQVDRLAVRYAMPGGLFEGLRGGRWHDAVADVSFAIDAGGAFGIVGESGSGKSSIARAILGLAPRRGGQVRLDGIPLGSLPSPDQRRALQIVFQDPFAALNPRMTVGQSVAEPLEIFEPGPSAGERKSRIEAAFGRVGLDPALARRYPHELSGGQNQRVNIARALIAGPRLLICDEATSALDATHRRQIIDLLRTLRDTDGLTLMVITHDLAAMAALCDFVLVLQGGRVVEAGPVSEVVAAPASAYTRRLMAAVPSPDPRVQRGRLAAFAGRPTDPVPASGG